MSPRIALTNDQKQEYLDFEKYESIGDNLKQMETNSIG